MRSKITVSLSKRYRSYLILVSCSLILLVAILTTGLEYANYRRSSCVLKETIVNKNKIEIKNRVLSSINTIGIMRQDVNDKMRQDVKKRVDEGYAIACNIYENNKTSKSKSIIIKMIKDALRPIRFFNDRGYFFMNTLSGICLLDREISNEGKNSSNIRDAKGGYPMQKIINVLKDSNKGFVSYYWTYYHENNEYSHLKTAYVKKLPFYSIFIGVGEYKDAVEIDLQNRAVKLLTGFMYNNDGYVFINKYDGTVLNALFSAYKVGDNIKDFKDRNGVNIFEEQYNKSLRYDGGYFNYNRFNSSTFEYRDYIAYVKALPDWEWIIGSSANISQIDDLVNVNQRIIYKGMMFRLLYILIIIIISLVVVFYIAKKLKLRMDLVFKTFFNELNQAVSKKRMLNPDAINIEEYKNVVQSTNSLLSKQRLIFDKLENSEQKFRMLIKNVPAMIIGIDKDQKLTVFNRASQNFFGVRSTKVIEKEFYLDVFFDVEELKKIRAVMENNRDVFTLKSYRTKDGREFSHLWNKFELANGERMYVGFDLTEQYANELLINNQKAFLEALIDTIPLPVFYKNLDGVYVGCNQAYADSLGITIEDIIGSRVDDIYAKDVTDVCREKDAHLLAYGGVLKYEASYSALNDELRYYKLYKALYKDHKGKVIGILGIAMDITDRVVYAKELRESNKTKDRFFSIIAHDLRNPFNSLLGILDILREDYDDLDDDTRKEYLSVLSGTTNNLYRLLTNLLEWSRTQTNSMKFEASEFNITELVEESLALLSVQADKKGISLIVNIEKDTIVIADKNMIYTMIRNLVSNAIKFTPPKGGVEVKITKWNNILNISVIDTGVGISEDIVAKLFSVKEKISTKGTENEPGTGIGLILCKEFIDKHSGTIYVSSEKGKGSTFSVDIPQ
ncbi:MAG: cache domain-containing protein [Marinifilaceae bacterium]